MNFFIDPEPILVALIRFVRDNQAAAIADILKSQSHLAESGYQALDALPEIRGFEIRSGEASDLMPCLTLFPRRSVPVEQIRTNEAEIETIDHTVVCQIEIGDYNPKTRTRYVFAYSRLLYDLFFFRAKGTAMRQWKPLKQYLPTGLSCVGIVWKEANYFLPGVVDVSGQKRAVFFEDPQMQIVVRMQKFNGVQA